MLKEIGMSILQDFEWEILSDIINQMNCIKGLDDVRLLFLQKLKKLIDYDFAEFSLGEVQHAHIKLVDPVVVSNFSKSFEDAFMKKYESRYGEMDYVRWIFSNYESVVYRESDLINEAVRKKAPFYIEYLEPHGLIYLAGISIVEKGGFVGGITFYNTQMKKDFSDRDLYILKQLLPHLEQRFQSIEEIEVHKHREQKKMQPYQLTARECEMLQHICRGLSNLEIAEKNSISVTTVKKHINNIFMKTGVKSRTQLITMFLDQNDRGES